MRTTGLLQATWRGIPFFVKSEGMTEAGRRIILHDYPNSDKRYVEDLGEIPPKFKVDAFVSGPDFADRASQLERALKESGKGTLTMPTFGSVSLFAMPYRKDASQQSVGEIHFELEFVRGETVSGPVQADSTTETVYTNGDAARVAIGNALEDKWIIPWNYATSLVAQFDLQQVLNSVVPLDTIINNVTKFTQVVGYIQLNIAAAIQSGNGLKVTLVDNLFQTLSEGLDTGFGLTAILDLANFGSYDNCPVYGADSDDGLWPQTTKSRVDSNTNRLNITNTTRLCALVNVYEIAASKTYGTVEEIEQTRTTIEQRYTQLMRNEVQSSPTVRQAMKQLRIAALDVMQQKEQTAYRTTTITQNTPTSMFLLGYQLYANTDNTVTLRALNPGKSSCWAEGEMKVLQS